MAFADENELLGGYFHAILYKVEADMLRIIMK